MDFKNGTAATRMRKMGFWMANFFINVMYYEKNSIKIIICPFKERNKGEEQAVRCV